jgi:hypothetical protein
MAKHQCVQFGVCPRADSGECFEVNADFRCARNPEDPECRNKLEAVEGGRSGGKLSLKLGIPAVLLVVVGVAIFFATREPGQSKGAPPAKTPPTVEELLKEVWPWLR